MDPYDSGSIALKEECRVNWKIANFSEIRGSKEALEAETYRFEMGSSIKLPTKLKCYLTCKRAYGRMWINPVLALDEKPSGNVASLFATLKVEVNEGSVFTGDTSPMCNIITDSISSSPLLPQVYLSFEAEFRNYVNADGSLYLSLIVNLYHFENPSSTPPSSTLWNIQLQFEQKQRQKLQQDLSKLFQNPESYSQSSTMRKVVSRDNKEFFVNPDILQVRCPVLYSMLAEDTSPVFTLSDISGQQLETLLDFVHTARVPFPGQFDETTDELVYVATKFGLMNFVEFLEDCRQFKMEGLCLMDGNHQEGFYESM